MAANTGLCSCMIVTGTSSLAETALHRCFPNHDHATHFHRAAVQAAPWSILLAVMSSP